MPGGGGAAKRKASSATAGGKPAAKPPQQQHDTPMSVTSTASPTKPGGKKSAKFSRNLNTALVEGADQTSTSEALASRKPTQLPAGDPTRYAALSLVRHPVLPPATVAKARQVFEGYLKQQQLASDPDGTPATFDATQTSQALDGPLGPVLALTADTVETIIADLGLTMSPNAVKDLLFALNQSADIAHRNVKAARKLQMQTNLSLADDAATQVQFASGEKDGTQTVTTAKVATTEVSMSITGSAAGGTTTMTGATGRRANKRDQAMTMSFRVFLDLMVFSMSDCEYESEMPQLWRQLDADGDGQLGARDIQAALKAAAAGMGGDEGGSGGGAAAAPALTPEQLRELLAELDCNDDGTVTYADFLAAMNTN